MSSSTHNGPLHAGEVEMQRRRGVLEAGRRVAGMIHPTIPAVAASFLERQSFAVTAILDDEQRPWAALWTNQRSGQPTDQPTDQRTGQPGFLRIQDEHLVKVPEASLDDLSREKTALPGKIGLLAIDFETRRRMRLNGHAVRTSAGLELNAEEVYSNCPKYIQKRILLPHIPRPAEPTRGLELDDRQRRLLSGADTLFLASHNPSGGADASHRGGEPGFVRWLDEKTLEFPDYSGNNLFNTLGNLVLNPRLGLLALDFENGDVLHLTGTVDLIDEDPEASSHAGSAGTLVRFGVEEWYEQRRALPWRAQLLEASPFNPKIA